MRLVWVSFDVVGHRCLEASAAVGGDVVGIVTLPGPVDANRSGQCRFDDVAERVGATLVETADVNADETLEAVSALEPDLIFVVGWSQLAKTGVTLFEIVDATADSGPIVGQLEIAIAGNETATTLFEKAADAHVELIRTCLPQLIAGTAPRLPQDPRRASAWPRRTPGDGIIDWETRGRYLDDWVRAQTRPYPGAFTYVGDEKLVVWEARHVVLDGGEPPGTVVERRGEGVVVACGEDALLLEEVELEGAGAIAGAAVGDRLRVGTKLG